ncbi:MAG: DUF2064 domain-containing protein [Spirosomataceae bacterium]
MKHTTAILLFAEHPFVEAIRKPLCSRKQQNSTVFSVLNRKMKQVANATELPVFDYLCTKNSDSFGSELTTAVSQLFAKGFEKIICIGNDCPAITTELLIQVASQLKDNNTVLGGDHRGGAYLIGLSRASFDAIAFQQLPWLTSRLFSALSTHYENARLLAFLPDIHTAKDLRIYSFWQPRLAALIRLLVQLLQSPFRDLGVLESNYFAPIFIFRSLRAPPRLRSFS